MRATLAICLAIFTVGLSSCTSKSTTDATQRVSITVTEQGFEPAVVNVKAGQPVTLLVKRTTDRTCATEVVMKEHNINQPLPLNQEVEITFTPAKSGDLVYACAMDMYKGKIVVK